MSASGNLGNRITLGGQNVQFEKSRAIAQSSEMIDRSYSDQPVTYRNPAPTVDIIIELSDRPHRPIVLIERLNPPYGWAIPGGFVDYGESVETAAQREAKEEVGLTVTLIEQFHVYSAPDRDPRNHTLSIVFLAKATGTPIADDDAKSVGIFAPWEIPTRLCFDHDRILKDYLTYRDHGLRPRL